MGNRRDAAHVASRRLLTSYPGPLLLPEPLLSEIGYMLWLRAGPQVEASFLSDVADDAYTLVALRPEDVRRAGELVEQYANLPLGTADACVVAVAERYNVTEVATLDRKHFSIVRPKHTAAFTMLP
jgi:predicted nucleic acid-binding protein